MPTLAPVDLAGPSDVAAPSHRPKGLPGAIAGSTLEVFDWSIYTTFAPFFAASFFAAGANGNNAFLETMIVFAVGYIARPLGSILFGHLSDTRGRKVSLYLTSATALAGTLLLALAPSRSSIGAVAGLVLVTARLIQGIAHGGEQPAAGAYLAEVSKPHNRGAWSSVVYMSIMLGSIGSGLLGYVLTSLFSVDQLKAGGWRIAYVVGALGSLVALLLVRRMPETRIFATGHRRHPAGHIWREIWQARTSALQIIGVTLGLTIAFQNWAVIGGYHIAVLHTHARSVMWTGILSNVVMLVTLPLWGALSDRIGRKPVLLAGFAGLALTAWPFMHAMDGSVTRLALTQGVSFFLLAAPLSIWPALMAELVPTSIRTIGVGLPYAISTAIFGGTVPALQTWISSTWNMQAFGGYVALTVVVSLLVTLTLPETRGADLEAEQPQPHKVDDFQPELVEAVA